MDDIEGIQSNRAVDLLVENKQQIERIKKEDKEHPENYCHICGGKNINWYVDNDLWNEVVPSDMKPSSQIFCLICFVKLAEEKGIIPTAWRLSKEGDAPEEKIKVQAEQIKKLRIVLERRASVYKMDSSNILV